jgi:hypothetical protein
VGVTGETRVECGKPRESRQAADTYCRVEKNFSTRCLSAEVLFSPMRGRRRTDAPCPFPYSSETQTIILGIKRVAV